MNPQVIYLNPEDDIVSIRDRLDWARGTPVILVLPDTGNVLNEYLDLALLRRHADALHLEVALVTLDGQVRSQALALGFPTFRTVRASRTDRRGWWRGRRRRAQIGRQTRLDPADRQEVRRRGRGRPVWQRWLLRYAAILLFFLTLTVLFVATAYAVPGATITLQPEMLPLEATRQIVADPGLESVDYAAGAVPGRLLYVTLSWQTSVATTGVIEVPDAPARGRVVFINQLDQPVTVPAGTRVSTTGGSRVVFQTVADVDVPGVVGGTAETDVVAVEPGPGGNVEANLVNRVEGALALQVQVRNLDPINGGAVREAAAVTAADQERLQAQVFQQLQVLALGEMDALLVGEEFLARESLEVVEIIHETYSHFPGEQTDQLTLAIQAELRATAVDPTLTHGLVYEELAAAVQRGYELQPGALTFRRGRVLAADEQGRVTFEMVGSGRIAAQLDINPALEAVAGQETEAAMAYLYQELPLRNYPTVRIWPNWFDRLPYVSVRIKARIETSG